MKENLQDYWLRMRDNAEVALRYAESQLRALGYTAIINDNVAADIGETAYAPGDDAV